jgi:hypothetical protein
MGDSFIRIPLHKMKKRPDEFTKESESRRINPTSAEDIEPK